MSRTEAHPSFTGRDVITAIFASATLVLAGLGCGGPEPQGRAQDGPVEVTGAGGSTGTQTGAPGGTGGASAAGAGGGGAAGGPVSFPIPDWPTGAPAQQGLDPAGLDAAAAVAAGDQSHCLLVVRHGVLVAEHYWNGHDATTTSPSWSIAKSYSSALVGIALDRGDIHGLDDSVADYVPAWKGTDHEAITVRHLLSMTSGLAWDAFQDYVTMATFTSDQSAFATGLAVSDPPSTKWVYHNGGVQMLEPLFRGATGHTIEEYAQAHLWSKLGMKASWAHDGAGQPTTYANVLASCRDHARLGYLYLHGGRWGSEQVVSPGWVTATLTPSQAMNRAYGYLWWLNGQTPALDAMSEAWPGRMVPFAPQDLFAARGFGNQFIDVIPSLDLVVVRFGPDPASTLDIPALFTDQRFEEHDAILKPILDAIVK
jgi:CubicO group peptidase (beta-lactamase class C family)